MRAKLTQMIQHGLVVEDNSSNNALNYREMTSKDDIGAVYREHMPKNAQLGLGCHSCAQYQREDAQEASFWLADRRQFAELVFGGFPLVDHGGGMPARSGDSWSTGGEGAYRLKKSR